MQVSGGSQSFNALNQMRVLGRWMRLITIPNQSSVAKAFLEFDEAGRMKPSAYYERVVDVMEELVKFTLLTRDTADYLWTATASGVNLLKRSHNALISEASKAPRRCNAAPGSLPCWAWPKRCRGPRHYLPAVLAEPISSAVGMAYPQCSRPSRWHFWFRCHRPHCRTVH
jgi:hypothetical protein